MNTGSGRESGRDKLNVWISGNQKVLTDALHVAFGFHIQHLSTWSLMSIQDPLVEDCRVVLGSFLLLWLFFHPYKSLWEFWSCPFSLPGQLSTAEALPGVWRWLQFCIHPTPILAGTSMHSDSQSATARTGRIAHAGCGKCAASYRWLWRWPRGEFVLETQGKYFLIGCSQFGQKLLSPCKPGSITMMTSWWPVLALGRWKHPPGKTEMKVHDGEY